MCVRCLVLDLLTLKGRLIRSNKGYWRMTNLFVLLHGGKDYCNHGRHK